MYNLQCKIDNEAPIKGMNEPIRGNFNTPQTNLIHTFMYVRINLKRKDRNKTI